MAATCVVPPASHARDSGYHRQRILKPTTGWAERTQFGRETEVQSAGVGLGGLQPCYRRYLLHTATSTPPPTRPIPTSRTKHNPTDNCERVSVLVASLLRSIAHYSPVYGTSIPSDDCDELPPTYEDNDALARACITTHSNAPPVKVAKSTSSTSKTQTNMDFNIDFGSTSGFKSHAKKKKPAAAAKADPWGESSNTENKDDNGANDAGGDGGAGGGYGGDAGAGGGGDDNGGGGGNDDDDAWGFSSAKKGKKKTKKKQEEEEEEDRRRKEEEEAQAAAGTNNADPLSWADDTNGDAGNEDWGMSWGGGKKDKKKKNAPPAAPDAPPATNAFQDISLDDGAPKLDFSFDGLDGPKKDEAAGGFGGTWGKSWDFGAAGKPEEKKEEVSDLGSNNPWGFGGSKTKKKSTMSSFDFGDFGTTENNDLTFDNGADAGDSKADDAWGFGAAGKKDKKKKGAIEEIKEEPADFEDKADDSGGTWGTKKTTTKSKKKGAFDDLLNGTNETDNAADSSFGWGFGTKDKKKDPIGELEEKPKEDAGDDWMSGGWGATGKKKTKKIDDFAAPVDLGNEPEPVSDGWGAFSTGKKKGKKSLLDDEPLPPPEAPEPPPVEMEIPAEPLVAWDFGLSAKDKKKKQKQMQLEGLWEKRVTQEMVDDAEAEAAARAEAAAAAPELDYESIPPPPPPPAGPVEIRVAWDEGLSPKDKRKKQKDMTLNGTWDDRVTQEMVEADKADAEAAAASAALVEPDQLEPMAEPEMVLEVDSTPLEDLVPWDYMMTSKDKKKKEKEMRLDDTWDDRLTQDKINQMIADRDAAVAPPADIEVIPELEAEPEPIPPPAEPGIPLEDLVPWDQNLSSKDKKKKEKQMRLDGTWDDRLTQDKIDQMVADRAAATITVVEPEFEPEPILEPESQSFPEPAASGESLEELEMLQPWDHNLNAKDKKKKEKQMRLEGTWDSRLTQNDIDDRIAAAKDAAASNAAFNQDPEPEQVFEPELELQPEPEPTPIVEERFPWDHGLGLKDKKKKEKAMRADGTWANRLTQEKIDEEEAAKAFGAAEPEVEPFQEPEPEPVLEEVIPEPKAEPRFPWDHGLNPKDKKKKEKNMRADGTWSKRLTQEKIDEEEAAKASAMAEPQFEPEPAIGVEAASEDPVDNGWGFGWGAGKTKPKKTPEPEKVEEKAEESWGGSWGFGKKKKDTFDEPTPIPEPEPEPFKEEKLDDTWGLGATSKDKKKKDKGAKKSAVNVLDDFEPPAPPPPAFDEPEPEPAVVPSVDDFDWGGVGSGKKSAKTPVDEAPTKKSSSSLWGFGSSSSAAKPKKEKEAKAKKDAEEQARKEEEERQQQEEDERQRQEVAEAAAAEEAAKAAKKTKGGKLSKSTSKMDDKKKSGADLLDLLEDPVPTPIPSSSKLKKSSTRGSDNKYDEVTVPEEDGKAANDYFGTWGGGSKKTAGKKSTDPKKEIKSSVLTNEEDELLAELNEDEIQAILDDAPAPSSPKLTKTMSNGKSKSSSSIADRIKALEGKKDDVGKRSKTASVALIDEVPEPEIALSPKEEKKAAKAKVSSAKASKSKVVQPPSPEPSKVEQKKSKDSIPGGFPGAFGDDDDLLADEPPPPPEPVAEPTSTKTATKKSSKIEKKPTKATSSKKKSLAFEEPAEPEPEATIDPMDFVDKSDKLPTPPPDDEKRSEKKKERPRVERSATSSWGFWGASAPAPTPKKPVRSKTYGDVSPPSARRAKSPPAVTRSTSHRKSRKEEADLTKEIEKASKTSGSDKEGSAQPSGRPKPGRGLSFTNFLSSAPPSAMRNGAGSGLRRTSTSGSKSSSRRQSMVDSGLQSPPPDDDRPMADKAAKMMGFGGGKLSRRSSTKEKSRSYPDPYPIDDDDMVMIHATDKEAEPTPRSKPKHKIVTLAKRSSTKPRSKTISGDEDVVMIDSPLAMDSANEDFERPQLQRSNTSKRSLFGGLGGFFGGSKTPVDKPRSTPVTDNEDNALPIRSRGNSQRRSRVISPADGFTTDAPGEADPDTAVRKAERRAKRAAAVKAEEEDRLAREARRRERRDREKADLEARRERAREQARKEREAEDAHKEERRARRREKEAAERARVAQEDAEAEAAAEQRREERRRLREQLEAENGINQTTQEERRRTYTGEEEARKRHKESSGKRRTKESSGRRSTALMAEYHESRSGSGRGIKPPENKTSSWIDSQNHEPPDLPPVEGTVLDPSGQSARPVADPDAGSKKRRKDKHAGMAEDEVAMARERRRERKVVEKEKSTSHSGGSEEKMQKKSKRASRIVEDDFYGNGGAAAEPVRTFDGRPQQTKRNSFLGKFF